MIHLLIVLSLCQNPENYQDSLYKYKMLWIKNLDTISMYSDQMMKLERQNKNVNRQLKDSLNRCMDRSIENFSKYFEYKKKVDSIKMQKNYYTKA